jgi:hypothetical protein
MALKSNVHSCFSGYWYIPHKVILHLHMNSVSPTFLLQVRHRFATFGCYSSRSSPRFPNANDVAEADDEVGPTTAAKTPPDWSLISCLLVLWSWKTSPWQNSLAPLAPPQCSHLCGTLSRGSWSLRFWRTHNCWHKASGPMASSLSPHSTQNSSSSLLSEFASFDQKQKYPIEVRKSGQTGFESFFLQYLNFTSETWGHFGEVESKNHTCGARAVISVREDRIL